MLDPDFATQIDLNLAADPIAPLRFDVWDDDSGGKCHAASPPPFPPMPMARGSIPRGDTIMTYIMQARKTQRSAT